MTKKEKKYHIYTEHAREITEGENLVIDIFIKLTDEEKELMDRQHLQVNEQKMLDTGGAKTISYTHMIEHIIKETNIDFQEKIEVNNADRADAEILKKYMSQLLNLTEKHILKSKKVEDLLDNQEQDGNI